jgi:hypothetical protein
MSPVINTPDTQSSETQTTDTQGSDSTQPAIAAVGDASSASFSESEAAQAYFYITAEMLGLSKEEVMRPTLDIPRATTIALGAAPHIHKHREEIAKELPLFPLLLIDNLPRYARGARYAHHLAYPQAGPTRTLDGLLAEAAELRETLLVSADPLVHAGILDGETVADVRSGTGNYDRANDLAVLGRHYAANWHRIGGKTVIEAHQVRRAEELANLIFDALAAERQPVPADTGGLEPLDARARAFTVFVRAYAECRRAIGYIRGPWGDADEIAPSLFSLRTPPSRKPADPTDPAAPVEPKPIDVPIP